MYEDWAWSGYGNPVTVYTHTHTTPPYYSCLLTVVLMLQCCVRLSSVTYVLWPYGAFYLTTVRRSKQEMGNRKGAWPMTSHDHSIRHRPANSLLVVRLEPSVYLQLFLTFRWSMLGSRPWPFMVTRRRPSRHVTSSVTWPFDPITWPWKVKVMTPICFKVQYLEKKNWRCYLATIASN